LGESCRVRLPDEAREGEFIRSLRIYLLNKFNGFDDRNDHNLFEEETANDCDGLLMKEGNSWTEIVVESAASR
jgi:hypothetical protein